MNLKEIRLSAGYFKHGNAVAQKFSKNPGAV
jgi:hypothetical protein